MFLRLAETLTAFLARLRSAADTLDVLERQRIVRLVVKEVLIGPAVSDRRVRPPRSRIDAGSTRATRR
jgi:site-specific DNA recombinase